MGHEYHSENRAMSAAATITKIQSQRNAAPGSPYAIQPISTSTLRPPPVNGLVKAATGHQSHLARPYSTYSSQAATLKRIKSELETIQERKEDREPHDNQNDNNFGLEGPIMENILLDESYSFSLRQFEQQKSKRGDLHQMSVENPYFEQSRMSNMSAYNVQNPGGGGGGDSSQRAGRVSVPGTDHRPSSSKVINLIGSHEFRPFSKPRKSKPIAVHDMEINQRNGGLSKRSTNNNLQNQWMPSSTIHSVQDNSRDDDNSNDERNITQNVFKKAENTEEEEEDHPEKIDQ